jgi:hypothetical protein
MTISNARLNVNESPAREEARRQVVHLVEYSRYPRHDPSEDRRVAYTQDRSDSGLGLDLSEVVEPGELLRITLRDIDGEVDMDGLARVVWCKPGESGRARAGLALLRENGEKPMIRVREAIAADSARGPYSRSN